MRILVVEDEARLATLLRRGLTEGGHAIDLAGSGEDALDSIALARYDAIVLDVMLPGYRWLRGLSPNPTQSGQFPNFAPDRTGCGG